MRRFLAPLLATLAVLVPAATASAADTVVASVNRPTMLSAYGSGLLWSQLDPATGKYQLWYTEALHPPAPLTQVPERSVPFDADLGPLGDGRFVAVYSRCDREPAFNALDTAGPPDYTTGQGCDLYEYVFGHDHETKLGAASSRHASEVLPSVWKNDVAFARRYPGNSSTYVYTHARSGHSRSERMPAGSPSRRHRGGGRTIRARATALELYGRRLALAWTYDAGRADGPASQIRLDDTHTKHVDTVDDFEGGGLTTIQRNWPSFESGSLYYGRACEADPGGCPRRAALVRYRYSTSATFTADLGPYDIWSARAGGVTYVLRDSSGFRACFNPEPGHDPSAPTCQILALTPTYEG